MRTLQAFTNKISVPVTLTGWQSYNVAALGVDPDAKLVTVEFQTTESTSLGARAPGLSGTDTPYLFPCVFPETVTLTIPIVGGVVDITVNKLSATVSIVAEWGGNAVVVPAIHAGKATGITTGNSGLYRPFDLKDATGFPITPGDEGNIAAVISLLESGPIGAGRGPDCRASGSTFDADSAANIQVNETVAGVDSGDDLEVRENTGGKGNTQNSFVWLVAYIKAGAFDDGTGEFYEWKSKQTPAFDGIGAPLAFNQFGLNSFIDPETVSIYYRIQSFTTTSGDNWNAAIRAPGSTNPATSKRWNFHNWSSMAVDPIGAFQFVEIQKNTSKIRGGIFGWLNFTGKLPRVPIQSAPIGGATGAEDNTELDWRDLGFADPIEAATEFDLYFGTAATPPILQAGIPTQGLINQLNVGSLLPLTQYFWRVVARNANGESTSGTISYTTGTVPGKATNPNPANGATGLDPNLPPFGEISFTEGSSGPNDQPTHDIYFGTTNPPPFLQSQSPEFFTAPIPLDLGTTYYWRVDEINSWGTTAGDVWAFGIAGPYCLEANPGIRGRILAGATTRESVIGTPSTRDVVLGDISERARIFSAWAARARIVATPKLCGELLDMRINPLCPIEMNWNASEVLELADVEDNLTGTPSDITFANSVSVAIFDLDANPVAEISGSPVALVQVGATNTWRATVDVTAANGFSQGQRLRLEYSFDGGVGLQGFFEGLAVVASATS